MIARCLMFAVVVLVLTACLAPSLGSSSEVQPTLKVPVTVAEPTQLPIATPTTRATVAASATSLSPARALAPAPAQWHAMVYHDRLGQVLLVNGRTERERPSTRPLEVWGWHGQTWELLAADGPTWRNGAAVAYDSERDVLVVHGGWQGERHTFDETWEWNGQAWTRQVVPGPGFRYGSVMAYDPARRQTVLVGGLSQDGLRGDTWAWDGRAWSQLASEGPSPRFPGALAYDETTQRLVLFGGHLALPTGETADYGDTWVWDGRTWQEVEAPAPGIRLTTTLLLDQTARRLLLIGGASDTMYMGDMWAWDGSMWTLLVHDGPRRGFHSVAYDLARQRLVLYGGFDRQGGSPHRDTWEWDGARWRCAAACA